LKLKLFLHRYFSRLMLISQAFLSVKILRLFRIHWLICFWHVFQRCLVRNSVWTPIILFAFYCFALIL